MESESLLYTKRAVILHISSCPRCILSSTSLELFILLQLQKGAKIVLHVQTRKKLYVCMCNEKQYEHNFDPKSCNEKPITHINLRAYV